MSCEFDGALMCEQSMGLSELAPSGFPLLLTSPTSNFESRISQIISFRGNHDVNPPQVGDLVLERERTSPSPFSLS